MRVLTTASRLTEQCTRKQSGRRTGERGLESVQVTSANSIELRRATFSEPSNSYVLGPLESPIETALNTANTSRSPSLSDGSRDENQVGRRNCFEKTPVQTTARGTSMAKHHWRTKRVIKDIAPDGRNVGGDAPDDP